MGSVGAGGRATPPRWAFKPANGLPGRRLVARPFAQHLGVRPGADRQRQVPPPVAQMPILGCSVLGAGICLASRSAAATGITWTRSNAAGKTPAGPRKGRSWSGRVPPTTRTRCAPAQTAPGAAPPIANSADGTRQNLVGGRRLAESGPGWRPGFFPGLGGNTRFAPAQEVCWTANVPVPHVEARKFGAAPR